MDDLRDDQPWRMGFFEREWDAAGWGGWQRAWPAAGVH